MLQVTSLFLLKFNNLQLIIEIYCLQMVLFSHLNELSKNVVSLQYLYEQKHYFGIPYSELEWKVLSPKFITNVCLITDNKLTKLLVTAYNIIACFCIVKNILHAFAV